MSSFRSPIFNNWRAGVTHLIRRASNFIAMGCNNQDCLHDLIVGCPATVKLNARLDPLEKYFFELTDGFGNIYSQEFTTDTNGNATLDMATLPEGFANCGQGDLFLRVKDDPNSCDNVPLPFLIDFECVKISFRAGTSPKDEIGCPFTCGGGGSGGPVLDTPRNFRGTVEDGRTVLSLDPVDDATVYFYFQDGVQIHTGPETSLPVEGLTNGQEYEFSVFAAAPGFSQSPTVSTFVTPRLVIVGYFLQRTTNTPPTEAEILAGTPFVIPSHNADYSVNIPNVGFRFIEIFEPATEQVKQFADGVLINDQNAFGQIITVGAFRGYVTNFLTAFNSPIQLEK